MDFGGVATRNQLRPLSATRWHPLRMHADPPSTAFVLTRVNWFAG